MLDVKSQSSTLELHLKLLDLSMIRDGGISSVGVKFVDIRRNTSGENGYLGHY